MDKKSLQSTRDWMIKIITWLSTKPASETYDYWDLNKCLLSQFAQYQKYTGTYIFMFGGFMQTDPLEKEAWAMVQDCTFGAAKERFIIALDKINKELEKVL